MIRDIAGCLIPGMEVINIRLDVGNVAGGEKNIGHLARSVDLLLHRHGLDLIADLRKAMRYVLVPRHLQLRSLGDWYKGWRFEHVADRLGEEPTHIWGVN